MLFKAICTELTEKLTIPLRTPLDRARPAQRPAGAARRGRAGDDAATRPRSSCTACVLTAVDALSRARRRPPIEAGANAHDRRPVGAPARSVHELVMASPAPLERGAGPASWPSSSSACCAASTSAAPCSASTPGDRERRAIYVRDCVDLLLRGA